MDVGARYVYLAGFSFPLCARGSRSQHIPKSAMFGTESNRINPTGQGQATHIRILSGRSNLPPNFTQFVWILDLASLLFSRVLRGTAHFDMDQPSSFHRQGSSKPQTEFDGGVLSHRSCTTRSTASQHQTLYSPGSFLAPYDVGIRWTTPSLRKELNRKSLLPFIWETSYPITTTDAYRNGPS